MDGKDAKVTDQIRLQTATCYIKNSRLSAPEMGSRLFSAVIQLDFTKPTVTNQAEISKINSNPANNAA